MTIAGTLKNKHNGKFEKINWPKIFFLRKPGEDVDSTGSVKWGVSGFVFFLDV